MRLLHLHLEDPTVTHGDVDAQRLGGRGQLEQGDLGDAQGVGGHHHGLVQHLDGVGGPQAELPEVGHGGLLADRQVPLAGAALAGSAHGPRLPTRSAALGPPAMMAP